MKSAASIVSLSVMLLAIAAGQTQEATSLFGKPLISTPPTGETKARLEADLAKAQAEYDRNPSSAEATIWLGRRLAYLGRFNDAIAIYTRGIQQHPDEARLYRHRGHRYITIRKFDLAIADLRRASQLIAGQALQIFETDAKTALIIVSATRRAAFEVELNSAGLSLGIAAQVGTPFTSDGVLGDYNVRTDDNDDKCDAEQAARKGKELFGHVYLRN